MLAPRNISLRTQEGILFDAYLCGEVEGERRPGLLLLGTVFGLDEELKQLANVWAGRGYVVLAPDYFFRIKPGPLSRELREEAISRWQALDIEKIMVDAQAMRQALSSNRHCNGRFGAIGICAGGELAFLAGTRLAAEVVVTYHGNRIAGHLGEVEQLEGSVCLNFGALDEQIPLPDVALIQSALAQHKTAEVHVYGGARHGFSFSKRPSYHPTAARESDLRAQALMGALK
jgi:carboxymethylenebutenolidase